MTDIFLKVADLGIDAGFLILAVIAARLLLARAPKSATCLLWVLVAARLLVPFQVQSAFSLVPDLSGAASAVSELSATAGNTVSEAEGASDGGTVQDASDETVYFKGQPIAQQEVTRISVVNGAADSESEGGSLSAGSGGSTDLSAESAEVSVSVSWIVRFADAVGGDAAQLVQIFAAVWFAGVVVMLGYLFASAVLLRQKVSARIRLRDNVYVCDDVKSPFILGIFRPEVCLPSGMDDATVACVLRHERAHIRRKDHIWKPLGFLILSVYWFCPLCWAAYILFCRDVEFACDERAVRGLNGVARAGYCQALLDCSRSRRVLSVCPVAFGEIGVKKRIRAVADYKKPTLFAVLAVFAVCAVVALCFFTSPKDGSAETVAADTESEDFEADTSAEVAEVTSLMENWANAFESRDGAAIREYASTQAQEALEKRGLLDGDSFGYSSPWPFGGGHTVSVSYESGDYSAEIRYYALTSDPHVVVWKESLNYAYDLTEERYHIVYEELHTYDDITSGEEFADAYADGIWGTFMDYEANGLGETLNANVAENPGYTNLLWTVSAAKTLLNLSDNGDKVTVEDVYGTSSAYMVEKISFPEDGVTVYVSMEKPWGDDGIWIPKSWAYSGEELVDFDLARGSSAAEQWALQAEEQELEETDIFSVMSRVIALYGDGADAIPYSSTADWTDKADVLVKLAEDLTGEYEVYGVISAEYGEYGLVLNDVIDGENNFNYVYESWYYTGAAEDAPTLTWDGDGKLWFTYPTGVANGEVVTRTRQIDCGYETAYMGFVE